VSHCIASSGFIEASSRAIFITQFIGFEVTNAYFKVISRRADH
jgi:hypothetical protein